MVTMLFNKVLGENENCVSHFYLKTEGSFGQPNTCRHRMQHAQLLVTLPRWGSHMSKHLVLDMRRISVVSADKSDTQMLLPSVFV